VHGEDGQATVEWVALVLAAALVLTGAGALAGREADRGLGEEVAKRITGAAGAAEPPDAAAPSPSRRSGATPPSIRVPPPAAGAAPPPTSAAPPAAGAAPLPSGVAPPAAGAAPPSTRAAPRPASGPRAVDAFRSVRGVADVAKHAWIVCLGYERWRHELEHPTAPNEALPVDVALSIVNTCFNPHDYLLEEH
jgi:hypothetical protein